MSDRKAFHRGSRRIAAIALGAGLACTAWAVQAGSMVLRDAGTGGFDFAAVPGGATGGPEFRKKMQNAQKALLEFDLQFDSFIG